MPASLTHHLFTRESLSRIGAQLPFVKGREALVSIGSQGPDPFYFYGFVPWRKRVDKQEVNALGTLFHASDPIAVLPDLIGKLAAFDGEERQIATAFLYGFLMHYVLDRQVHPYVFFHSGFDLNGGFHLPYSADHARFESLLDTAMMNYFETSFTQIHPYRSLLCPDAWLDTVDDLFAHWRSDIAGDQRYSKSLGDMRSVLRAVFGKAGIRRKLIKALVGERSLIYAMAHPPKISKAEAYDYLNLSHRPWRDPSTGIITTDSVIDRFEVAQRDMAGIASLLIAASEGKEILPSEYQALFRSIDYDGKLAGSKQLHFQSIYPAQPGFPSQAGDSL
jgi:hypothetical protein